MSGIVWVKRDEPILAGPVPGSAMELITIDGTSEPIRDEMGILGPKCGECSGCVRWTPNVKGRVVLLRRRTWDALPPETPNAVSTAAEYGGCVDHVWRLYEIPLEPLLNKQDTSTKEPV